MIVQRLLQIWSAFRHRFFHSWAAELFGRAEAALCDMIRCEPRKVRLDRSKTRCARLALATMTLFLPNQIYAAGSRHGHFSHCVVFMVGGGDLRVVLC